MRKNNKSISKKLTLDTETVRGLDANALDDVAGGGATAFTCRTCVKTLCFVCGPHEV